MDDADSDDIVDKSDYTLAQHNKLMEYSSGARIPVAMAFKDKHTENAALEASVLKRLLQLDDAIRTYFKEWSKEISLQRMAAEKLIPLSRNIEQIEPRCRAPEPQLNEVDDVILSKYKMHYQLILNSNKNVEWCLSRLRKELLRFRRIYNKLDLSMETPFICGDAFHKPISFFRELTDELFNYFYAHFLNLDANALFLDPTDIVALEHYQKLLERNEEFEEYLLCNLSYCRCLRKEQPCPETLKPLVRTDLLAAQKRAKQSRCQYRIAKMVGPDDDDENYGLGSLDSNLSLEHENRMNHLTIRLAQLRENRDLNSSERDMFQQMITRLSPSLV